MPASVYSRKTDVHYSGDVLWALMLFLVVSFVLAACPVFQRCIISLVLAVAVEVNQLYHAHTVSRQTVQNILVQAGLGPEPHDNPDTWSDFLKRHAATMWQCDFACKKKWTMKGMVELYFLVFIHIGSRRIWISPCTANPSGELTTQQARTFSIYLYEQQLSCTILQRDQDTKFVDDFEKVFSLSG